MRINHNNSRCIGVDLNRNNGIKWMASDSSSNPCSEVYAGAKPDSEPETKAFHRGVFGLNGVAHGKAVGYINIHSYGNAWLVIRTVSIARLESFCYTFD